MNRGDRLLIVLTLILTMVGLVMVYSSGSFYAFVKHNGDANYFLKQQLFRTLLGIGVLIAASRVPLKTLERLAPLCFTNA